MVGLTPPPSRYRAEVVGHSKNVPLDSYIVATVRDLGISSSAIERLPMSSTC